MLTLYIGNKNYSSWSLRGWLAAKLSGAPFREVMVGLTGTYNPDNRAFSPTARVPALRDGNVTVWDSMGIAEYLAERHPRMWPADATARAFARCASAEMHAGFAALRNDMTMCIRERLDVRPWSPDLTADIERITEIWTDGRKHYGTGGDFLCGEFSLVDAFFGPVAFRFQTYRVHPAGAAGEYLQAMLGHPFMREWEQAALAEKTIVDHDEPRVLYRDKLARQGDAAR
jgi:glutathione S-transferase